MPAWYVGGEIGNADFGSQDDTSIKFLGGYQFHRHFAAEVGYGWLFDKNGAEVTALELVGLGIYPITNQLSIYGKLGLANIDVETRFGSQDSTELTFGAGLQYDITPKFGVRGQFQRYDTDQKVDVFSIGVLFRF